MNLLNVLNAERDLLTSIEFTKSTLLSKLLTELQPLMAEGEVSAVLYPKGLPNESLKEIKTICSLKPDITVEESKTLLGYIKQTGVKPEEESFWVQKGFEPTEEELGELVELYNSVLSAKNRIIEITGFKSVNVVWTIKKDVPSS